MLLTSKDYLLRNTIDQTGKAIDIHKWIGKLPKPKAGWVLPKHKFCGPYNPLEKQLDEDGNPLPGHEPYNQVDSICLEHDKDYDKAQTKSDKHEADKVMLQRLKDLKPRNFRERVDKAITRTVIGTKYKLGLGITDSQRKLLDDIYYSPKTGYIGVDQLSRRSNVSKKLVKDYLVEQETYTKHKPAVQRFPMRKVVVHGLDHQWQADLADMRSLASENDGYNYILTVIDVLSKYAWAIPIKRKTGDFITDAFREILKVRKPNLLQTDKGTEFINKKTQELLKEHDINWFASENETKAQIVERFNRTLKDRMYKYFTANNTKRWIDVLPDLVFNYNTSHHRAIKMTPTKALETPQKALENLRSESAKVSRSKFKIGDFVRISKHRGKFKRGYTANFTNEVFVVTNVLKTKPVTYEVADVRNADKIIGTFYAEELSLFKPLKVEQII